MDNNRRFKVLAAAPAEGILLRPTGMLEDNDGHVACGGTTVLKILKLQPDNAKPMDIVSAVNGGYLKVGDRFS